MDEWRGNICRFPFTSFGGRNIMSKLDQLREMTTVVADTGDIEAVRG